jgi:hypothetical protein
MHHIPPQTQKKQQDLIQKKKTSKLLNPFVLSSYLTLHIIDLECLDITLILKKRRVGHSYNVACSHINKT